MDIKVVARRYRKCVCRDKYSASKEGRNHRRVKNIDYISSVATEAVAISTLLDDRENFLTRVFIVRDDFRFSYLPDEYRAFVETRNNSWFARRCTRYHRIVIDGSDFALSSAQGISLELIVETKIEREKAS